MSRSPAALRDLDPARFPGDFAARVRTGEGGGGAGAGVLGTLMPRTERERTDAPRIESCDDSRDMLFDGGTEERAGAADGRAGALLGCAGAAEGRGGAAEGRAGALLGCAGAAEGRAGALLGAGS
jgi:hypothetical protein